MNLKVDARLRDRILRMAAADQHVRRRALAARRVSESASRRAGEAIQRVDARNTRAAIEIVNSVGWPHYQLVGKRAGDAFWLLVQHADDKPKLQQRCLALMARATERGEASPKFLAYLTDRVRLAQGRRQLYGTQFTRIGSSHFGPRPLVAPSTVDRRRAAQGIEPLSEYAKKMGEFYFTKLKLKLPPSYRTKK